jgi:hypothetical protein
MKPLLLQYEKDNHLMNYDKEAQELRYQVELLVWFQAKLPVWNEMVRKYE